MSTTKNIIISLLALSLTGVASAQQVHQGESFTLSGTLPPAQSHEYTASRHIDLNPGFHSEPSGANTAVLEITPYLNFQDSHGLLDTMPPDHDTTGRLGFYPMDFRVNECGAATISMPLEFPEGVNGMTPHLSLEYNSQAGNGILGLGWSLGGMSKISRVPYSYEYSDDSHSVQFSIEDQLSLDGNILKKGTFNGMTCYYPEIYDFSVVIPITDGFKVLKNNGFVYTYAARYYLQQAITNPIEWHLSKVEDADGNSIEYDYENDRDNGAFWPISIRYTCHEGTSAAYEILFDYDQDDERPDCPPKWFSQPGANSCNTGFSRVTRKLKGIQCYHGERSPVQYTFTYTSLDWNIKALACVEKSFHRDPEENQAVSTIIPVKYTWEKTRHFLQYEQAGGPIDLGILYDANHLWQQHTVFSARLEQNNMSNMQKYEHDIVHLAYDAADNRFYLNVFRNNNIIGEQNQVYYYNPANYSYDCSAVNDAFSDMRTVHALMPADTDGDGLDEIVCVHSLGGSLAVSLIRPTNGVFQITNIFSYPTTNFDPASFQTGDFNGDGLSDLLCVYSDRLQVRLSDASGAFSQNAHSSDDVTGNRRVVVADFNGDKRDQIMVLRRTNDHTETLLFKVERTQDNSHNIPSPTPVIADMPGQYFANTCNRLCCGDFNGDGKRDVLLMCSGDWRFYFSKGNGLFTDAQLVGDDAIVQDNFALATDAIPVVTDFDHDGCDDVSLTLLQDFVRPTGTPYLNHTYKGAFRRDFLIRPTQNGIQVRKIRKTRGWWENGIYNETDACIDSIITNAELFSTVNVFFPVVGNHKGTSPNEILYCRMGNAPGHSNVCACLHNTGNFQPDSLTRAVTRIVNSLGVTSEIRYTPVSFQYTQNESPYNQRDPGRSLTPVLPFSGFMNVVERVMEEVKDNGAAQAAGKSYRLARYHYNRPYYHTRGRGFLGFGTVWSRKQGQIPGHDVVSVMTNSLDQDHHILVPESQLLKHFRENNIQYMDPHQQTHHTYGYQDNTDFASDLGQIPDGVFAPFLSSSLTVRDDGTPTKYEKTVTARDGYGNVTVSERRLGTSGTSFPYHEKTETSYDHSVSASRWILGVPAFETVERNLTGVPADKVMSRTEWNNDMTRGRHLGMVKEPGSGKQLAETYGYDAFGHLASVTRDIGDGRPRTETRGYSADGRFMTSWTNAAGHTTRYYHNAVTGLPDSVTDPNGLTTKYSYDFLWDLVMTELPSGVREEQRMKWVDSRFQHPDTWHPDTPGFGAPVYFIWSKRSGERETVVFYDQHRRRLREVGGTMDGKKVYVDYRYHDVTGLLTAVSAPYCPEENETARFTQYTYDYLDRIVRTDRADGAFMTRSHGGLTETVRGFDGQVRTLTRSRAGLVTKVSDYGSSGGSPVDIDYTWYGDGKVKSVKVDGDNATLTRYTYDVNRNPSTVSDPALGLLSYEHNGFGELVQSTTPRNTTLYAYDALGRITTRTDFGGSSTWTYDNGFLGALSRTVHAPVTGPSVTERFTHDRLGRLTGQTQTVGSAEEWAFAYGYDAMGRRNAVTYPSGIRLKWHYDNHGFMDRVKYLGNNALIWQASATDRWGNVTTFSEGDIQVRCSYDAVTGLPTGISTRRNGQTLGQALFGQACSWSATGNLEWRTDTTLNLKETFTYDRFNRLVSADAKNLSGTVTHASQGVQFDGKGNITQKDGAGGYAYGGGNPYAVTTLVPEMAVTGVFNDQTVTYTPFDKVGTVCQDGRTLSVDYGIDRQRVTQTLNDGFSRRTKRYFTPLYETVTENGVTKKLHYLTAANGIFAIFVSASTGENTMYYTLKDHQGSLTATVHGNTVERLNYDPWGRRRNTTGFGYSNVSHTFDRGYTLHEHYDDFDLINMDGRLYDPILGRMLSPDVVIQDEQSSQAYNRYSYCFNNPLRFTDPSGYFVENPPYQFMLLNPNKTILKYYYGVEPSTVEYNTDDSEGTQRVNVKWKYEGDDYEANWVHQNLEGYYQTDNYGCLATCMVAQERRFSYGNMDITEESMLGLFPNDNGIKAYDGWISFEELTNVYHKWENGKTALADPFVSEFENKYGSVEQYSFDAMNKGEGITYHYFTDDPNMNHAINANEAVRYFDGNKNKTIYNIKMWDPDPKIGGSKPFTRYRLNKIHTLKLNLH